jgi:virulence-associated protein VagC
MEPTIRNLVNMGGNSKIVTLPKSWIRETNSYKRVKITQKGKNLIISPVEEE